MKKKFALLLLSLCLMVSSFFMFSACSCNDDPDDTGTMNVFEVNNEYAQYCNTIEKIEKALMSETGGQTLNVKNVKASGIKDGKSNSDVKTIAKSTIDELMDFSGIEDYPQLLNTFKSAMLQSFDLPKTMGESITRYLNATTFFNKTMVIGEEENTVNQETYYHIGKSGDSIFQLMYVPSQKRVTDEDSQNNSEQWIEESYNIIELNFVDENDFSFYSIYQNQSGYGNFVYGDNEKNIILINDLNANGNPVFVTLAKGDLIVNTKGLSDNVNHDKCVEVANKTKALLDIIDVNGIKNISNSVDFHITDEMLDKLCEIMSSTISFDNDNDAWQMENNVLVGCDASKLGVTDTITIPDGVTMLSSTFGVNGDPNVIKKLVIPSSVTAIRCKDNQTNKWKTTTKEFRPYIRNDNVRNLINPEFAFEYIESHSSLFVTDSTHGVLKDGKSNYVYYVFDMDKTTYDFTGTTLDFYSFGGGILSRKYVGNVKVLKVDAQKRYLINEKFAVVKTDSNGKAIFERDDWGQITPALNYVVKPYVPSTDALTSVLTDSRDKDDNPIKFNLDTLEINLNKPFDAIEELNKLPSSIITDRERKEMLQVATNDVDNDYNKISTADLFEYVNSESMVALKGSKINNVKFVSKYNYTIYNATTSLLIQNPHCALDITKVLGKTEIDNAILAIENKYKNNYENYLTWYKEKYGGLDGEYLDELRVITIEDYLLNEIEKDDTFIEKISNKFNYNQVISDNEYSDLFDLPEDDVKRQWIDRQIQKIIQSYQSLIVIKSIQEAKGYTNDVYTFAKNVVLEGDNLKLVDFTKKNVTYDEYCYAMDSVLNTGFRDFVQDIITELHVNSKQNLNIKLSNGLADGAHIYIHNNFLSFMSEGSLVVHLPFSLETVKNSEELQLRIFGSTSQLDNMISDYESNNNRYVTTNYPKFNVDKGVSKEAYIEYIFADTDQVSPIIENICISSDGGLDGFRDEYSESITNTAHTLNLPTVDMEGNPLNSISIKLNVRTKERINKVIIPACYTRLYYESNNQNGLKIRDYAYSIYKDFDWKFWCDIDGTSTRYLPNEIEVEDGSTLFSVNADKNILKSKDGKTIYMLTDKDVETLDLRCERFSENLAQVDLRDNFHKVSKFLINYKINKYYFIEYDEEEMKDDDKEIEYDEDYKEPVKNVYEFYKNGDILQLFRNTISNSNAKKDINDKHYSESGDVDAQNSYAIKPIEICIYGVGDNTSYELETKGCQIGVDNVDEYPEFYNLNTIKFDNTTFNYYKSADTRYISDDIYSENNNKPDFSYDFISYKPYVDFDNNERFFKRPVILNLYGDNYMNVNVNIEPNQINHLNSIIELNLFDSKGNVRNNVNISTGEVDMTEIIINNKSVSLNPLYNSLHSN